MGTCAPISVAKWCIVGNGTGALRDLCYRYIKHHQIEKYSCIGRTSFQRTNMGNAGPPSGGQFESSVMKWNNNWCIPTCTHPAANIIRLGMVSWWRHQMETFSALLAICVGNSTVPGEFPAQRPVTQSFDVFFDLRPNKLLSKQSWGWWFETPTRSLWRHCNFEQDICLLLEHKTTNLVVVCVDWPCILTNYDGVIKWEVLPRYRPFVRGIPPPSYDIVMSLE